MPGTAQPDRHVTIAPEVRISHPAVSVARPGSGVASGKTTGRVLTSPPDAFAAGLQDLDQCRDVCVAEPEV